MKLPKSLVLIPALVLMLLASPGCATRSTTTALDRYVAAPDPAYQFKLVNKGTAKGMRWFTLDMTSQKWLTPGEVDRTEWKHWVHIVIPDKVEGTNALMFISGGGNGDAAPRPPDDQITRLAAATRSVVAEVKMIPNQPLVFNNDGKKRVEDDLIAYTWDKFLRTGDERWPARLPMTKAVVRAMDSVQAFCKTADAASLQVGGFVVAGGSKRGWTTWTTAIVDKRVVAIAPIVIDMLNITPSFKHHWEAYGFYAPAVDDYVNQGIMNWMGTPEFDRLMKIVEPYEYRDRLTLPKLIINATGDQFFLPDSSQFYFKDLLGVKYLRYVPNADHSLRGSDAVETLAAWHHAIQNKTPLPRFTWSSQPDGSLKVVVTDAPAAVKLWQATNPEARDFRVDTIGKSWTATDLADQGGGVYVGRINAPAKGWSAFLVELTYKLPGAPAPLKLTTQVNVVPDILPHKMPTKRFPAR